MNVRRISVVLLGGSIGGSITSLFSGAIVGFSDIAGAELAVLLVGLGAALVLLWESR